MTPKDSTSLKTRYGNVNFRDLATDPVALTKLEAGTSARFWRHVSRGTDSQCWLWAGATMANGRYGAFSWAERAGRCVPVGAHRAAYELTHGPIPAGFHVLHSCDTPLCVNPAHLSLGTHADNMRDAARKGRLSLPSKVNRAIKPTVIDRYLAGGVTQRQLADEFGVSHMTVLRWLKPHKHPYQRGGKKAA